MRFRYDPSRPQFDVVTASDCAVAAIEVSQLDNARRWLSARRHYEDRLWHKADIEFDAEHVCFRRQSRH